jgi:hypothetical protein
VFIKNPLSDKTKHKLKTYLHSAFIDGLNIKIISFYQQGVKQYGPSLQPIALDFNGLPKTYREVVRKVE